MKKVEGIVIKSTDYGEANKVITLYTREAGKIGLMARGAKKTNSRFSSASQLFTYGTYLFYPSSGLGGLQQADVIDGFRHIQEDIFSTAYAAYIVELLYRLTEDKRPNPYLFELLYQGLHYMNEEVDPEVIKFMFELKMLPVAGIAPELDQCVRCHATEGHFSFSVREGGFLCHRCESIDPNRFQLSKTAVKLLRLFYHFDMTRLGHVDLKRETKNELKQVIDAYYEAYSGLHLKSKRFLEQMERLQG